MGHKIHPSGLRLGITQEHRSKWFATSKTYPILLQEDFKIRTFIQKKYGAAGISDVLIARKADQLELELKTARPGVIVGSTVMDIVTNKKFLKNIKRLSKYFFSNLNIIKKKYPKVIKDIRGKGYLIGIQLYKDQTKFIQKLMDKKLLTIRAAENVIRVLPPLNVKKNELDQALKIIDKVCAELK